MSHAATASSEPLARELSDLASRLRRSTVEVRTRGTGAGSGIIWSDTGLIITNAHVARTEYATIVLADGRALEGVVTARDPRRDLATIAIDPTTTGLAQATIGHPTDLRTGNVVIALGHPLGITNAIAFGVVHVVEQRRGGPRWIRADIRLAPGNSGGPLADVHGRVVGVNTLIAGGLGVAVPVTTVARFLADVEAHRGSSRYRAA
jgi:serine protease Do